MLRFAVVSSVDALFVRPSALFFRLGVIQSWPPLLQDLIYEHEDRVLD